MRFRVHFRRQFDAERKVGAHPIESLGLPKGLILKAIVVEPAPLDSLPVGMRISEDDDFLNIETEIWDFDIVPGRKEEFVQALKNSGGIVLDYEQLDGEPT
jgi:hypothetical protein